ncbi:MAG: glycine betaine ABC transporter substrate-binding protein [Actinomycetota bacterium]
MGGKALGVLLIVIAASIAACGSSAPVDHTLDDDAITIASFDFDESETLAEVYAGALRSQGFEVRHARRVGTREVVLPALERGLIEVVPDYAGSAVAFLGGQPSVDPDSSLATLRVSLGSRGIEALEPAPAQSRNGLVVTTRTATEHGLRSVSDLRSVASAMTIGGPPECPERELCLLGFAKTYGLEFASFLPLDAGGPVTAAAVQQGTVDVGVLFTSDGSLAQHGLVLLRDDRRLQPAENVTPLVRRDAIERFGPGLTEAIDAVSAELTTTELRALNALVSSGVAPAVAAARWLDDHHLGNTAE